MPLALLFVVALGELHDPGTIHFAKQNDTKKWTIKEVIEKATPSWNKWEAWYSTVSCNAVMDLKDKPKGGAEVFIKDKSTMVYKNNMTNTLLEENSIDYGSRVVAGKVYAATPDCSFELKKSAAGPYVMTDYSFTYNPGIARRISGLFQKKYQCPYSYYGDKYADYLSKCNIISIKESGEGDQAILTIEAECMRPSPGAQKESKTESMRKHVFVFSPPRHWAILKTSTKVGNSYVETNFTYSNDVIDDMNYMTGITYSYTDGATHSSFTEECKISHVSRKPVPDSDFKLEKYGLSDPRRRGKSSIYDYLFVVAPGLGIACLVAAIFIRTRRKNGSLATP